MQRASRIVERALELADMSGSHVISYQEEREYLEQAWKYVNNKCTQQGVKYFYGRCPVMSGVNRLPWDFDQLDTIKTRAGYQLPRHTNDMDENFGSYDIVGNSLIIYGTIPVDLTMFYWKKPITLTFPAPIKKVELPFADIPEKWDIYGDYLVYEENGTLTLFNLKKNEVVLANDMENYTINEIKCGKGSFYVDYTDENNVANKVVISYKGKHLLNATEGFYVVEDDDTISLGRYYDDGGHYFVEITRWYNTYKPVIEVVELTNPTAFLYSHEHLYCITEGNVINAENGELLDDSGNNNTLRAFTTWEDNNALSTNNKYIWSVGGDLFNEPFDLKYHYVKIIKLDNDTGYGILTTDGTDLYIESHIPDTAFDFPSTLMYDFLSYYLAYLYQLKLGVDTTNMEKAFNAAEELLISTLDSNYSYKTMQDVTGGDYVWR